MKDNRLPHNSKEEIIYGGVICLITVIIMLILNIGVAFNGFSTEAILSILKLIPIIWVIAMLLEGLVVGKISTKLVNKFTEKTDGFNTKILFNILFCVTAMSFSMTIIGGMIGTGSISMEPIITLPSHFPRNFFVAFWCEILLAQPIARLVMKIMHNKNYSNSLISCEAEDISVKE